MGTSTSARPVRAASRSRATAKGKAKGGIAASYNRQKLFEGRRYTGMAIGRGHTWRYDAGEWKEKKLTPDRWEFTYSVTKRRKGHAPEGSGAPVGTEYHWYILAHQVVRKLNANDYSTSMSGAKYKLAHKRAASEAWNLSDPSQRRQLIRVLEQHLAELRRPSPEPQPEEKTPPTIRPPRRRRARTSAAADAR